MYIFSFKITPSYSPLLSLYGQTILSHVKIVKILNKFGKCSGPPTKINNSLWMAKGSPGNRLFLEFALFPSHNLSRPLLYLIAYTVIEILTSSRLFINGTQLGYLANSYILVLYFTFWFWHIIIFSSKHESLWKICLIIEKIPY